jgi:hypothetical protein
MRAARQAILANEFVANPGIVYARKVTGTAEADDSNEMKGDSSHENA